jgi:putative Mg2+ transporter-C (MgtC) family protein
LLSHTPIGASDLSISDWELLLRLGLATVLCGAIGLERESRGQAAGLRTHILVGVGSALFTLVSAYAFEPNSPGASVDPTRIAAQIVTGIGFLGAGTIIRQGLTVRGLTTAAALWIVAAIGMAAGAGFYVGAVATTVVVLVSLVGLRRLRPTLVSHLRTDFILLELELSKEGELGEVFNVLGRRGLQVRSMDSRRGEEEGNLVRLELLAPPGVDLEAAINEVRRLPGVAEAEAQATGSPLGARRLVED